MLSNTRNLCKINGVRISTLRNLYQLSALNQNNVGLSYSPSLAFNNAKEVFGHRKTRELIRAFLVLHACAVEPLVQRSYKLMNYGEKFLGPLILSKLLSPFYNQFVAGDSEIEMKTVADNLLRIGVNLMVAPMLETDIGNKNVTSNKLFEENFDKTIHLINLSAKCKTLSNQLKPLCQTKITAHIGADVLFNIAAAYETLTPNQRGTLIRNISKEMKALSQSEKHVFSESCLRGLELSQRDQDDLIESIPRLVKIGQLCKEKNVILLVDAEYSYTNAAISLLTLSLMTAFNNDTPVIWNTYQGYLKTTHNWLQHDLNLIQSLGVSFGAKIVRGAYMELERDYAFRNKQSCPVTDSYELTNKNYDSLINFFMPFVANSENKCHLVVATHNEASVLNATQKMEFHNIPKSSSDVMFAQIYGMAENISVPLSKAGYSVYKSVPYGSIIEVMPYLSRRANENRAVFLGARRERELLSQEILRRFKAV